MTVSVESNSRVTNDSSPKARAGAAGAIGGVNKASGARAYDNAVIAQLMAIHEALLECAAVQEKGIRKSAKRYKLGFDARKAVRKTCTPKRKAAASLYHAAQLMVLAKRGQTEIYGPLQTSKPKNDEFDPNS